MCEAAIIATKYKRCHEAEAEMALALVVNGEISPGINELLLDQTIIVADPGMIVELLQINEKVSNLIEVCVEGSIVMGRWRLCEAILKFMLRVVKQASFRDHDIVV